MAKKLSTAMLTALAIAHSKGVVQIGDDQRAALLGMAGRVSANTIYALHALGSLRCTLDGLHYELTLKGLSALGHNGVISAEEYTEARRKWDAWMDVTHAEALKMDERRTIARAFLSTPDDVVLTEDEIAEAVAGAQAATEALIVANTGMTRTLHELTGDADPIELAHAEALEINNDVDKMAGCHDTEGCTGVTQHPGSCRVVVDVPQRNDLYSRSLKQGPEVVIVDRVCGEIVWYRFAAKGLPLSAPYYLRLSRFVERYSRVPA